MVYNFIFLKLRILQFLTIKKTKTKIKISLQMNTYFCTPKQKKNDLATQLCYLMWNEILIGFEFV